MSSPVLSLQQIRRGFGRGEARLEVLRGVDFDLRAGEIVALLGPSGSGKSTMLHIAGLLEGADSGTVMIAGQDASGANDRLRTALRRDHLGFVYQFHHLLPEFSALENVVMPQRVAGVAVKDAEQRATALLTELGLASRLTHRPAELSGGEQQRVAIARALANKPAVLLADEPTGNLDPRLSDIVFDNLLMLARQEGVAALIATHNLDLAARMDRIVTMDDGHLVETSA